MTHLTRRFCALDAALLLLGLTSPVSAAETVEARNGMVVSVSAPASDVGVGILKKGGNAVDAAAATAFALAVTWPEAGNLGGGGFMLVYPGGNAEPAAIDYRETAPAAVDKDTFVTTKSHLGHKIVGVPGTVRGLALAHRRFGKLPWKDVVLPAVKLADEGFVINAALARSLNGAVAGAKDFPELRRVYGKDGGEGKWQAGGRLVQKELAATLRRIAEGGPDAFYRGEIADKIVAEMKAGGGLLTKDDLVGYEAKVRPALHGTFRGYDVYCPGAPAGGVCLVEMLNVLETFDLRKQGRWSPETLHLMIEAMRRGYCDRARYLGDPDFVKIPEHLTSKEYARKLAAGIDPTRATRSEDLAKDIPLADEGDDTTHFSVIDRDGMAVANTYTLEQAFGSKVVVKGAGFLLNNEMGDFNWRPGHTDRNGAIGTDPNLVAPGKRMLSSQTPTVVAKDGKVLLVTSSPGGRTIINTVLCVLLNVLEFEMDARSAVDEPRLHHQWLPDRVTFEPAAHKEHREALEKLHEMGHEVKPAGEKQGDAHTIWVDPHTGRYHGIADTRRDGHAAGY
jgi:gamma-glutamyltranspeptidase / glutathione hydrolase